MNIYVTSDLALTTVLSLFYPIDSINRNISGKVEFSFKRDASLDRLLEAYWRKELSVEPQTYFTQLKFIKSRIYAKE